MNFLKYHSKRSMITMVQSNAEFVQMQIVLAVRLQKV